MRSTTATLTHHTPVDPRPVSVAAVGNSRDELLTQLEMVRRQGYAVSLGERDPWAGAVAAPVFLGDVLVGCISVCGPHNRLTPDKVAEYGELVNKETKQLSLQLA